MKMVLWLLAFAAAHACAETGKPLLKDALGVCGHTIQFKAEKYAPAFSQVRDYHPIGWDLAEDTSILPNWPAAKNKVNWESVYSKWQDAGFRSIASLMFTKPLYEDWKDLPADAFAYGKSFADEFGPSGRDLIETVEIGNEPGHYTDEQYMELFQAMASGVRAGCRKMKIATCAARAQPSGKYFKSLDLFKEHLDLVDVITMHVYAQTDGWPTWNRTYPEDPATDFLQRVEEVVAWRDQHAPGRPVWVTEYGWDSTTRMEQRSGNFKQWEGNVSDEAQAAYLVRATTLLLHAGADRSYIYFYDDKDEPQLHGASGVMRNGKPKASFHALTQMQQELGEYRLLKIEELPQKVYFATWQNDQGESKGLMWRGVAVGEKAVGAKFDWKGEPQARLMVQSEEAGGTDSVIAAEPVGMDRWKIEVGPLPVYVE